MNKTYAAQVVLAVALGISGPALANDLSAPGNSPAGSPRGIALWPGAITGTVQDFDHKHKWIQIKQRTGTVQTVHVNPDTEIYHAGDPIHFSDVAVGISVTVRSSS